MAALLVLAPFAAFTSLMTIVALPIALFVGAALSAVSVGLDLYRGRSMKLIQAGAMLLFAALGCYVGVVDPWLSSSAARISLDTGLLGLILIALAARLPFTIQYARENVDADTAARPEFLRANYVLTWVWVAALVTMLAVDISAIFMPAMPVWTGVVAAIAARNGAMAFTQIYSARQRANAADRALQASRGASLVSAGKSA